MSAKRKLVAGTCPQGNAYGNIAPFTQLFPGGVKDVKKDGFDGIDCLFLWGGEDIAPSLYRQKVGAHTFAPNSPSARDEFEWSALKWAKLNDVPVIGICRGLQLGCVFAGGTLIQHVSGHQQGHTILTKDGKREHTTSVHHQMVYPWDIPHELLAWSDPPRSNTYMDGDNKENLIASQKPEPEIVYFPEIRLLGIQGHPEYGYATQGFKQMCVDFAAEYLLAKETING